VGGEGDMLDNDDGEGAKIMVDSKTSESGLFISTNGRWLEERRSYDQWSTKGTVELSQRAE
jgi:hypothetical protein